ncbi:MAG: amino acid-binding protein [Candidatus Altiarchaeota archaeon]
MLDLEGFFAGRGAQRRVAEFLVRRGLRVSSGGLVYAGDVEVKRSSIALLLGVDRRVVKSTIESIAGDERMMKIFSRLNVTPYLRDLAPVLGYGVIEIIPSNAGKEGIIAGVTGLISEEGIGIRQVIADDPMFDNPELTVITEKPIPRDLIDRMLNVEGVEKVVVLN